MSLRPGMLSFLCVASLLVTGLAGCVSFGSNGTKSVDAPEWRVGDTWVYARTGNTGQELVYERKVSALFMQGGNLVYELRSGLRSHPVQDYHLYRTDDLRFVGSDLRDGSGLIKRLSVDEPIVFHYVFPMEPGRTIEREGMVEQKVGGLTQYDEVQVTASVGHKRSLTLGERVYEVLPYEIRIRYEATPFDEDVVLQGHWSKEVGQSVLTILHEGGQTVRHELLYFERVEPRPGAPAYDLVPPLESRLLERGFTAQLDEPGWQRYLFHVEDPVRLGIDVSLPGTLQSSPERLDVVSLRPMGYTRAGIADQLTDLATGGLFLHVSAAEADGPVVHHHAAQGSANDMVYLQPKQVYELIVSSNQGGVNVRVTHGGESQSFPPVATGQVEVLSGEHTHVQQELGPGPQSLEDVLDVQIGNPKEERVEGIVYVINHGGEQALLEFEAMQEVHLAVDSWAWRDDRELYAYYFGYVPRDGFLLRTGFEYKATVALAGNVDYEMGVLLLKLLPP